MPEIIIDVSCNDIVNLHLSDGNHWVLIMKKSSNAVYYINSYSVETQPKFLDNCVDLGSDQRIQQDGESFCGAYVYVLLTLIEDLKLRAR